MPCNLDCVSYGTGWVGSYGDGCGDGAPCDDNSELAVAIVLVVIFCAGACKCVYAAPGLLLCLISLDRLAYGEGTRTTARGGSTAAKRALYVALNSREVTVPILTAMLCCLIGRNITTAIYAAAAVGIGATVTVLPEVAFNVFDAAGVGIGAMYAWAACKDQR